MFDADYSDSDYDYSNDDIDINSKGVETDLDVVCASEAIVTATSTELTCQQASLQKKATLPIVPFLEPTSEFSEVKEVNLSQSEICGQKQDRTATGNEKDDHVSTSEMTSEFKPQKEVKLSESEIYSDNENTTATKNEKDDHIPNSELTSEMKEKSEAMSSNCEQNVNMHDVDSNIDGCCGDNAEESPSIDYEIACARSKNRYEFFWRSDSVFSQWHFATFCVDDTTYSCAEQYMMQKKALLMQDYNTARKVMSTRNPRKQKALGREVQNFDEHLWQSSCIDIVKEANIAKFSSNPELKEILYLTHPKKLVEASPHDSIWGIGLHADDPAAWNEKTWLGENRLGKILTEVRNELMIKDGRLDSNEPTMLN